MEELEVVSVEETPITYGAKPQQLLKESVILESRYQDLKGFSIAAGVLAGGAALTFAAGFIAKDKYADVMKLAGFFGAAIGAPVSGWCHLESKKYKTMLINCLESCRDALVKNGEMTQALEVEQEIERKR